jgi:hypothetical protein
MFGFANTPETETKRCSHQAIAILNKWLFYRHYRRHKPQPTAENFPGSVRFTPFMLLRFRAMQVYYYTLSIILTKTT